MPKLSEVMATPAPRMKLSQVMDIPRETEPKVFDLPAISARVSPQDDPQFTFPAQPGRGEDLLAWARFKVPELANVSDANLAAMIRREVYPDMDPVEFYLQTGLGQQFDLETPDPTRGMSGGERFRAGIGSALAATPRGLRQALTEGLESQSRAATLALEKAGLQDAARFVGANIGLPLERESQRLRREESDIRERDRPLLRTGAGLAGNIAGNVAQIVGPGGAIKLGARVPQLARAAPTLETASSVLLPETVAGSAASGAGLGAVQPVDEDESRLANVALSGLGGGVGAGLPRAVGGVIRRAGNLVPAVTERAQTRAAGEVLEQFAQNPGAVRARLAQSQAIVPGTTPSLAEATEDIGLAGLQKSLANTPRFGASLRELQEANNRARVAAIEAEFGGATGAAAEKLTKARDLAAKQALRGIEKTSVSTLEPVQRGVNRLSVKFQASGPVREALADVDQELKRIKTVGDAQLVRQHINQLIAGQVPGKEGAKLAASQLTTVRDLLDRQMRQDFPGWGQFLRDYKAASRQIGQVNIGEALLEKGPNIRAVGDIPVLSPDKFAGAASDLDRLAAQATGFRRARAERILTPRQMEVVDEVRRDLERYSRSTGRVRTPGSDTVQNALGGNAVQGAIGPVGAAIIEPVSGVALLGLNAIRKNYGEKVGAIVEEALLDPQRAAEILSTLPPKSRRVLVKQVAGLLSQAGSVSGRAAPTTE